MAVAAFVYGVMCYGIFFLTFLYAIGFIGNFGSLPHTVDAGGLQSPARLASIIDIGLLALFAIQHSGMARQGFKKVWTKFVPVPVERSTYVLFSSLALILLFWQWRPIHAVVWDVRNPLGRGMLWGLFAFGWFLVFLMTFMINHFELFGLRQVWRHLYGLGAAPIEFKTPFLYKVIRHPLYAGFIAAFWSIPTMTVSHLLFALLATGYILVAIQFEERDLMRFHPQYVGYRKRVPMLIPRVQRKEEEL